MTPSSSTLLRSTTPIWLNSERPHTKVPETFWGRINTNRVKLTSRINGSIAEIIDRLYAEFQKRKEEFPPFTVCYKGSSLAKLYLPSLKIHDYDVQFLFFPQSSTEDIFPIFAKITEITNAVLDALVKQKNFNAFYPPQYRNPILLETKNRAKHALTRLSFPNLRMEDSPLDISFHTLDRSIQTLSSFSLESFYIRVDEPEHLYSEIDEDLLLIIDQLAKGILLTGSAPPHKFAFYRFISTLTHRGLTIPEKNSFQRIVAIDSEQGPSMVNEMKVYITKKKIEGPYLLYLLNAFFSSPEEHPLFSLLAHECFKELLNYRYCETSLGFLSEALRGLFLEENHSISFEEAKKIERELKLFIPLISIFNTFKMHQGKPHILCRLSFTETCFYVLVPLSEKNENCTIYDFVANHSFFNSYHLQTQTHLLSLIENEQRPTNAKAILLSHQFDPKILHPLLEVYIKDSSNDPLSKEEIFSLLTFFPETFRLEALQILMKRNDSFKEKIVFLQFIEKTFPEYLEKILIDRASDFERTPKIHDLLRVTHEKSPELISPLLVETYFSLFLNQLDEISENKAIFFLNGTSFYLPLVNQEQRLAFIRRCSTLPVKSSLQQQQLLTTAIFSVKREEIKSLLNEFPWERVPLSYWITLLTSPQLQKEEKGKILTPLFINHLYPLLKNSDIFTLSEETLDSLIEKIHLILQHISDPSLDLPLRILECRPDKVSIGLTRGSIKQILDRYSCDLKEVPDRLWKQCTTLASLSSDDASLPWNSLLTDHLLPPIVYSYGKTTPQRSVTSFIQLLLKKSGIISLEAQIEILTLLGPKSIPPATFLSSTMNPLQKERLRPFLTHKLFFSLIEKNELESALKCVKYREPLTRGERLAAYQTLYLKSIDLKTQKIAHLCLNVLSQEREIDSFIPLLTTYYDTFLLPSNQKIDLLRTFFHQNKRSILPVYCKFYLFPELARWMEEESLQEIDGEAATADQLLRFRSCLIERIELLLSQGDIASAFTFLKYFSPFKRGKQNAHLLIDKIPPNLLDQFATLLIEQLESLTNSLTKSPSKELEENAIFIFSHASSHQRFQLLLKLVSLPLHLRNGHLNTSLFTMITSEENLPLNEISDHPWTLVEIQEWISFLPKKNEKNLGCLSKESFTDHLIDKIIQFSSSELLKFFTEAHHLFNEESECRFIQHYKDSLHRNYLPFLTHTQFSPHLFKDSQLYQFFLTAAQEWIQNLEEEEKTNGQINEQMIKTILTLVQTPFSFTPDTAVEEIDRVRFSIALKCIKQLPSFSRSLSWTINYATRNMRDPMMKDLSYEIIRLSPNAKTIFSFFAALVDTLNSQHYDDTVFHQLKIYLSKLGSCRLNNQLLAEAAPKLKKASDYLIDSFYYIPPNVTQEGASNIHFIIANRESFNQFEYNGRIAMMFFNHFQDNPETIALSQASSELINIISLYRHIPSSNWLRTDSLTPENESPLELIKKLTEKIHLTKLNIAASRTEKINCIADLKAYHTYLKQFFLSKELSANTTQLKSDDCILSADYSTHLFTKLIKNSRSEEMELLRQLIETIIGICPGEITQPQFFDLAFIGLSLLLVEQEHLPEEQKQRHAGEIQHLFLLINRVPSVGETPLWNFKKAVQILKLYHKSTLQESIHYTCSSLPLHQLPKEFVVNCIEKGFSFISVPSLNLSPSTKKSVQEDLFFLAICTYFSSSYTHRPHHRYHVMKEPLLDMLHFFHRLFPNEEEKNFFQRIFLAIEEEEKRLNLDQRFLFNFDVLKTFNGLNLFQEIFVEKR